jgi:hypothetical protein
MRYIESMPVVGSLRHVQVPGGFLQLAKIVAVQLDVDERSYALVRWIDIRRDAEWVPASIVPPQDGGSTIEAIIKSVGEPR